MISFINTHASSEENQTESKENFFSKLDQVFNSNAWYSLKTIVGYVHIKIPREEIYMPTIGKHNFPVNENGNIKALEISLWTKP